MTEPVVDYAQRSGTSEALAGEIAALCVCEVNALSAAYINEFFADHRTNEAKILAKIYVDQIASGSLEVRLNIMRFRIGSKNARPALPVSARIM